MITREAAMEIALNDALQHRLGFEISSVLSFEEIRWTRPVVYGARLTECWIAYVKISEPLALQSSTIIAVDKMSGLVVYRGSANDEG